MLALRVRVLRVLRVLRANQPRQPSAAQLKQPVVVTLWQYYSKGAEQLFFLDGQLVMSYSGPPLNRWFRHFCCMRCFTRQFTR